MGQALRLWGRFHGLALLLGTLSLCPQVHANEFSTSFVTYTARDVPVGTTFDLTEKTGKRLDLKNASNNPMLVQVQALLPTGEQLRGDARPIPDTRWVELVPPRLEIPAHSTGYVDVRIKLPKQRKLRRKTFQVMIWSKTLSDARARGVVLRPALLSRLQLITR